MIVGLFREIEEGEGSRDGREQQHDAPAGRQGGESTLAPAAVLGLVERELAGGMPLSALGELVGRLPKRPRHLVARRLLAARHLRVGRPSATRSRSRPRNRRVTRCRGGSPGYDSMKARPHSRQR
jgi:hypothetical protein